MNLKVEKEGPPYFLGVIQAYPPQLEEVPNAPKANKLAEPVEYSKMCRSAYKYDTYVENLL